MMKIKLCWLQIVLGIPLSLATGYFESSEGWYSDICIGRNRVLSDHYSAMVAEFRGTDLLQRTRHYCSKR